MLIFRSSLKALTSNSALFSLKSTLTLHTLPRFALFLAARHVFANGSECHVLARYQMWFAKKCSKNSSKSQKSPIFDKKCSCLVMLSSGSTEIWFQPELPDLYILHQEMVIFGIFSNILSNIHQPHLVAQQNVTFWRVGQCMSGYLALFLQFYRQ